MKGSFGRRGWWILAAAIVLTPFCLVPLLPAALDRGYFRPAFIRYLQAHFDRSIRIDGPLHMQLWSRHPRLVAEQVTVGNPPWVEAGEMARAGRITLVYGAPAFGRGLTLESITLQDATLHLIRDEQGRANWHRIEPPVRGKSIPLIKELAAQDVHVVLDDARKHLQFDGVVTAHGERQAIPQRLRIEGKGRLNGRPMSFELDGDPLDSVRSDAAYAWEFTEESSGSHARVHGTLPQPFNFDLSESTFEVSGEDLKDLYFLNGVTLVDTGAYHLTGNVERRGAVTRLNQVHLRTGQSDLDATLAIDSSEDRSQTNGSLSAKLLRTADFGARAAGRAPPSEATPLPGVVAAGAAAPGVAAPRVFSDARFNPEGLRRNDAQLDLTAQRLEVGRVTLDSLSGHVKIDHGKLAVTPLTAGLLQGKAEANIQMDANQDKPSVQARLRFRDLQLATLDRKEGEGKPPLEGPMLVGIDIDGRGRSIHQILASADGTVKASVSGGKIRASFAELAGIDLRALGLILTRSRSEVDVRCAAAVFAAHGGRLTSRSIVIDTSPVLIKGQGDIDLGTEELHVSLRGQPKDLRLLRVDAPLLVQGTLARPSIAIETHDSSLKLVDPGSAKDVDCEQLLAASRSASADP